MGHANRSRLDDALGLDARSRRLCFPNRRCWANSDADADGYTDPNGCTKAYSNPKAAPHAAAQAVRPGPSG